MMKKIQMVQIPDNEQRIRELEQSISYFAIEIEKYQISIRKHHYTLQDLRIQLTRAKNLNLQLIKEYN